MSRFRAALAIVLSCSLLLGLSLIACREAPPADGDAVDATAPGSDEAGRRFGMGIPLPTPGDAGLALISNGPGVTPGWGAAPISIPIYAPDAAPQPILYGTQGGGSYGLLIAVDDAGNFILGPEQLAVGGPSSAALIGQSTSAGSTQGGNAAMCSGSGAADAGPGGIEFDFGTCYGANSTVKISGGLGAPGTMTWSSPMSFTLQQSAPSTDIPSTNMSLIPQPPETASGTHVVGGDLSVILSAPLSGTTRSHVDVGEGNIGSITNYVELGRDMTTSAGAIYVGHGVTPSATNATLFGDNGATPNIFLSAPSGECVYITNAENTGTTLANFCSGGVTFPGSVTFNGTTNLHGTFIQRTVVTSTGTFTTNASTSAVVVRLLGGGGGGGGCAATGGDNGSGGGSGAYSEWSTSASASTGYSVTVGAAGTAASNSPGGNGGQTSITIGSSCTANGGTGGGAGAGAAVAGGAGGTAGSGCTLAVPGSAGGNNAVSGLTGYGAPSALGGGVQQPITTNTAGRAGGNYGAGGSACNTGGTAEAGGTGAAGVVIVDEYR